MKHRDGELCLGTVLLVTTLFLGFWSAGKAAEKVGWAKEGKGFWTCLLGAVTLFLAFPLMALPVALIALGLGYTASGLRAMRLKIMELRDEG